jgi:hypothetical protein
MKTNYTSNKTPRREDRGNQIATGCAIRERLGRLGMLSAKRGASNFSVGIDFAIWRLNVVRSCSAIDCGRRRIGRIIDAALIHQFSQKEIWALQLYLGWNAALFPVLDALNATGSFVVTQQLSEFCGSAKTLNGLSVGFDVGVFCHGVSIKHHV